MSGSERPGVEERWRGLPGRVRRVVGCALAVVLLMALGSYAYAQRADRPPPPPPGPPRPAQAVQMWSTGVGDLTSNPSGTFTLGFVANSSSKVTVERVRQTYGGIQLDLYGDRPVRVPRERRVTVDARIVSCSGLPPDARMPVVEFTVRNARGRQTFRFSPGERYAQALAATVRTACAREGRAVPGSR
ncbi:hypothetical protein GCM10009801_27000 [Streptomyces albiaxialis]|uniref:Tat pathway signal sequence domain protein n=1 Tax=Streptomyces albiaxialis TaxID=329523 RepID=A0ABN2VUX4_9ACTN